MREDLNRRGSLGRRRLLTGVAAGLLGSLVPRRLAAQEARVAALTGQLGVVTGSGTNIVVFGAADGVVLVDTGSPDRVDVTMASLGQLWPGGRVTRVFNTHWHAGNTGANERLRQAGATIVAHENTRVWMATPTWVPAEDRYRQPRPAAAHPTETFRTDSSMIAGRERIDYGYLLEAHTSGDIYVFFRDSNVLAVGDVASPVRDPELDYFTGAWIGGRVDAMDRLLALSNGATRIVPGMGPVMTKTELQAERDVMKAIYDRTADRIREGDSPDDMLEGGVLTGLPRTWQDPRRFLYDLSKGLWAHHNKLSPNVV